MIPPHSCSSLWIRLRMASRRPGYPCLHCGDTFSTKSSLDIHVRRHFDDANRFECHLCEKVMFRKSSMSRHVRGHSWPKDFPFECRECGLNYSTEFALQRHENKVHNNIQQHSRLVIKCDECGVTFPDKTQLSQHLHSHIEKMGFQCDLCKNYYNRKSVLSRHLGICKGVHAMYQCNQCKSYYKTKAMLITHLSNCRGADDM